ncbi:MAG: hypothetical protein II868_06040, partial [Butyrivibrio sp.]|nr:hypothetical protein [Butyrivibrio sp.]
MKKRIVASMIACAMAFGLVACNSGGTTSAPAASSAASTEAAPSEAASTAEAEASTPAAEASTEAAPADSGEKMYIPVMAKGFQHQFW